ncbi:hypothetical protein ACVXG7_28170 [Enterobacter hormaechei]
MSGFGANISPPAAAKSGYRLIKIININSKMLEAKVAGAGGHSLFRAMHFEKFNAWSMGITSMRMA